MTPADPPGPPRPRPTGPLPTGPLPIGPLPIGPLPIGPLPIGTVSRRAVLRGAAATGVAAGLGVTGTTGCGRAEDGPDELEAPLAAARGDAALAAAAAAAHPELVGRLTPVAEARRAHAEAVAAEIRRARPDRAAVIDVPALPAPAPDAAAAALAAVRVALDDARATAATLALRTEPYRCGLLASVAACCAGHVTDLA